MVEDILAKMQKALPYIAWKNMPETTAFLVTGEFADKTHMNYPFFCLVPKKNPKIITDRGQLDVVFSRATNELDYMSDIKPILIEAQNKCSHAEYCFHPAMMEVKAEIPEGDIEKAVSEYLFLCKTFDEAMHDWKKENGLTIHKYPYR